jgi:hypothetical protein
LRLDLSALLHLPFPQNPAVIISELALSPGAKFSVTETRAVWLLEAGGFGRQDRVQITVCVPMVTQTVLLMPALPS